MKLELPHDSRLRQRDFLYGVATASFQIEGGAKHRQPCIWDTFCATPGKVRDGSDGQVACDHYHRWPEDLDLIQSLGVDAYRLSISWGRLLNQDGSVNPDGARFYLELLDGLKARGIKAFVTLYHWDLPQHLEDAGGWLNRDTAYRFAEYADKASRLFGDRVHAYATLNEPFCSAYLGYEVGIHAPGLAQPAYGRQAAHHLLLAHGLAMAVLKRNCPDTPSGIVLNFTPCYPHSDSEGDRAAAAYADDYINQWYIRPLFEGRYPEIIETLPEAVKPTIEPGDMDVIGHPLDFLGVNFYTREVYQAAADAPFQTVHLEAVERTDIGWEVYPQALTDLLVSLHRRYPLPPVYITENGAAMADQWQGEGVQDEDRTRYYQRHLEALHHAIEQGVDVRGYFAWSLMDNFEWAEGYLKRFGIVYVDYPSQRRIIKDSGLAYRDFIQSRTETP
ncbi:GH1 family beta-glucosidase [Ferrimonas balearica]|uniref:GH1 family beta-glucosidase n=1 Tax=Ferrimonas balearica TaxID=44012 RepID=UPI001C991239|nr:GH1 family beta-glucosidase [Ferrimonas balearica]MBY5993977.1 beta-glucosidase [Ferrimonas balearica]